MASSSSSHQRNQELNAFPGIEPAGKRRKACESSRLFDVFINHRGPDVKQTLAIELYNSLAQLGIRAFLDSEEKVLGNSFPSTIETAIRSALVHIAIFSKRYAESAWCLAELVLMLQSEAKIIPVFYGVEPWELRHIEKGVYAEAFINYEEKGRYLEKLNEWKEALHSVSFIAGEEFNSFSDCKNIVAAVQKEVQRKQDLHVATYPVGLDNLVEDFERRCLDELVQDFESQCVLKKGKDKAMVVGIFGMGGAGKTTLAKELFNRKSSNYFRASFLFDVREASVKGQLSSLQLKLLQDLFDCHHLNFTSVEEGISYLKNGLRRSPLLNFLIVVDDIDHVEQLNALLVMDILNKSGNTLVIVTTRDAGVLINAGITVAYYLKGINRKDGRELFCWHAFDQPNPRSGYEVLIEDFIDVCGGLPLSLVVLGRHVHGRDRWFWSSELIKARKTLPRDIKQRLRISVDALDDEQKQVFMDTACFFLDHPRSIAEKVWKGSGWDAQHALEILECKCLVEQKEKFSPLTYQVQPVLRMHDHLRDLGREMAAELSPPHRLWRPQDLEYLESTGLKNILTKTNARCFHSIFDESMSAQVTFFLGQSNICVETSASLLWVQLAFTSTTEQPSLPSWLCQQNLQFLRINWGRLKTLWENRRQVPSHLKELVIFRGSLQEFPDILGISDSLENVFLENGGNSGSDNASMSELEKLEISSCESFVSTFSISGIYYPSLESIKLHGMENLLEVKLTRLNTLNCLDITNCKKLKRLTGTSGLTNLVLLNIRQCPDLEEFAYLCLRGMMCLEKIMFDRSVKVKQFELDGCQNLKTLEFYCERLVELSIRDCPKLEELPDFRGSSCLEKIIIDGCGRLKYLKLNDCRDLKSVSVKSSLARLVELEISDSWKLKYLCFSGMKCLEKITFDRNVKVKYFELDSCENLKTINFSYEELVELSIRDCPKLKELPYFIDPSSLEKIIIDRCGKLKCLILNSLQNLKSVLGNFELRELYINDCPELDELPNLATVSCVEEIKIEDCEKIQNITLPTTLFSLYVQRCRDLQRVTCTGDLTRLSDLYIKDCPELEELPNLATVSCMEKIKIEDCEKIQNITLPTTLFSLSVQSCRDLQRVTGTGDLTRLSYLYINDCPELEELPNLATVSCMEEIKIEDCEKIQNITLPTTLFNLYVQRCRDLQRVTGTGDLTRLSDLYIKNCPELEELPNLATVSCMEKIKIEDCEKIQNITLPTTLFNLSVQSCKDWQRVAGSGDLTKLTKLCIVECPELGELPNLATVSCIEEIEIEYCNKIQNITLPTTLISLSVHSCRVLQRVAGTGDLTKLERLKISMCPELEELPSLSRMSCLEEIMINHCEKIQNINLSVESCRDLQRVAGTCDLTKLKRLKISMCSELEELPSLSRISCLDEIEIRDCEKIQNITLPTTVINLSIESCRDLQRVAGTGDLTKLKRLKISMCSELEELPSLSRMSCLEEITINHCEKIQNIILPTTVINLFVQSCRDLQRVAGTGDLTKLKRLEISMCSALEELPSLSRLSCLETFVIDSCEKLENIAGIEELQISKSMRLCYCSNAVKQNCIHQLKSLPEWGMLMIGRAVDGAESSINENLFSDANIGADVVTDAVTDKISFLRRILPTM